MIHEPAALISCYKGEREDIPKITENLGDQFAGLLRPASNIIEGQAPAKQIEAKVHPDENGKANNTPGKGKGGRRRRAAPSDGQASALLKWQHDPGKWGTPRQAWSSTNKILWLMYVAKEAAGAPEISGPVIAETFNLHFRQAGLLKKASMSRDLGSLKQRAVALVGDRADQTPILWFLTDAGINEAKKRVQEARGGAAQPEAPPGA